jgi:hypothetical protein
LDPIVNPKKQKRTKRANQNKIEWPCVPPFSRDVVKVSESKEVKKAVAHVIIGEENMEQMKDVEFNR